MQLLEEGIRRSWGAAVKIIDARSGEVMTPGKLVSYGDGEKICVIDVDAGLFSARALVETTYRDYGKPDRDLVTSRQWVPLVVRFTHPAHLFQRVAFIPS
jgi:hypothetical protein